jgi:predicted amidophosphoribosyltransferase
LEDLAGALKSLCFPVGCRLRDQLLTDARRLPICDNYFSLFLEIPPGSCAICGQPGTFDPKFPKDVSYCPDCEKHRFAFQVARSFGVYEGTLARAVLLLKHEHIEPLGNWFAEQLAGLIGKESEQMAADTDSEAVSAD